MNAQRLLLAAMLALSLTGCAEENPAPALTALKDRSPVERRAIIKSKLSHVCPAPLTDAELERAAVYVETNAASLESQWVVGRLDRFDAETRICRGIK